MAIKFPTQMPICFFPTGVRFPTQLPIKLGGYIRPNVKLPIKVLCEYSNQEVKLKLPIKEEARTAQVRLPIKEEAWVFNGLVLSEYVLGKFNKQLTMMEEIRGRILADVSLVNKSLLKISWYGDKVDELGIYKKMAIDEEYELISNHVWDEGSATFNLDSSEYNIILVGANRSGESNIITIGEITSLDVNTAINIALNEKIYQFDIDFKEQYHFNLDF